MKFYVYILFRPDGRPCYVGKGTGDRWLYHERYKSKNLHLVRIVAKAGGELPKVKVREGLTEIEAFEIERALIAAIGREENDGSLVNHTDGGEGVANPSAEVRAQVAKRNASDRQRAAVSAAAKKRVSTPEGRAREAAKLSKGAAGPITDQRREAIRIAVTAYWQRRREQGLPLTNRTEAGHRKHSAAMKARRSQEVVDAVLI